MLVIAAASPTVKATSNEHPALGNTQAHTHVQAHTDTHARQPHHRINRRCRAQQHKRTSTANIALRIQLPFAAAQAHPCDSDTAKGCASSMDAQALRNSSPITPIVVTVASTPSAANQTYSHMPPTACSASFAHADIIPTLRIGEV